MQLNYIIPWLKFSAFWSWKFLFPLFILKVFIYFNRCLFWNFDTLILLEMQLVVINLSVAPGLDKIIYSLLDYMGILINRVGSHCVTRVKTLKSVNSKPVILLIKYCWIVLIDFCLKTEVCILYILIST